MNVWKTSEGDEILLEKMTDAHVRNAHAFLEQRLSSLRLREAAIDSLLGPVEGIPVSDVSDSLAKEVEAVMEEARKAASQRLHDLQWRRRFEEEAARRGLSLG